MPLFRGDALPASSLISECYRYGYRLQACTFWRVCRKGPCIYAMCLRVRVHACAGVGQCVCGRTCACVCVRTKLEWIGIKI